MNTTYRERFIVADSKHLLVKKMMDKFYMSQETQCVSSNSKFHLLQIQHLRHEDISNIYRQE